MNSTWFAWMTLLAFSGCGRDLTQEERNSQQLALTCTTLSGVAEIVGTRCYDSGFFPRPEGADLWERTASALYWFQTTITAGATKANPYTEKMAEFDQIMGACNIHVPNDDWNAVCDDFAACWAEQGLTLPEAFPAMSEPVMDAGVCGTVSSLPPQPDDD